MDLYELMDCVEAIVVFGDCNDLDKRPPPSDADVARMKAGKGVSKIRLNLNAIQMG